MTTRARALAGPIAIGLAAWCAAGRITVATAGDATMRIAVPAAWWIGPVVAILAACVPACRRRPSMALPALVSTLPWWPIALPPIAMLWTGPLAWLPIVLALAAAVVADWRRASPRVAIVSAPTRATALAFILTLLAGAGTAWSVDPRVPGGDEPHYLVITQSLLKDGDLRIENNHRRRDYASFFPGDLRPHYLRRGKNGQIYSIHAPGVSVLVLPAFSLFGYRGAQGAVLLLTALAGALVWRIGWRATADAGAAWFAWAAVIGSPTFLLQSFSVYPDGSGALAVAAAVWLLLLLREPAARVRDWQLASVGAGLAALPWLHTRFAVIAAGFGIAILWRLLANPEATTAERRQRAIVFLAIPIASALAWFAFFQIVYGTPNPAAPYGGDTHSSLAYVPVGLAGLLFDQQFGLIACAPVLAFAVVQYVRPRRDASERVAAVAGSVALAYLAAVACYWMWWAGNPAPPARFATAILPVLALPLAIGWTRATPAGRLARGLLLIVSLLLSGVFVLWQRGALAWDFYDAQARWLKWLGPVVNLPRAWPSFFWRLNPDHLSSEFPFVIHLAAWLAVLVATVWLATTIARRRSAASESGSVVVWSVVIALSVLVQTGWWLNRTQGLDATGPQLAVLEDLRQSKRSLTIGNLSLRRTVVAGGFMRIVSEAPGVFAERAWAGFADVPPGVYDVIVSSRRPERGAIAVTVGRSHEALIVLPVQPLSEQVFTITLPAGASSLTFTPDDALIAAGASAELIPVGLDTSAGPRFAEATARYGEAQVFFLDDGVFAEEDGFWVRGGRSAEVVVATAHRPSIELTLTNGGAANVVTVQAGEHRELLSLGPRETRSVALPAEIAGVVRLTVTSKSGFRPSDQGGADGRYLGVRVVVR